MPRGSQRPPSPPPPPPDAGSERRLAEKQGGDEGVGAQRVGPLLCQLPPPTHPPTPSPKPAFFLLFVLWESTARFLEETPITLALEKKRQPWDLGPGPAPAQPGLGASERLGHTVWEEVGGKVSHLSSPLWALWALGGGRDPPGRGQLWPLFSGRRVLRGQTQGLAGFDLLKSELRKRAGVFHTVTPVPPSPSCAGQKSKRWDGGDRGGQGGCSFFAEERGARGEES